MNWFLLALVVYSLMTVVASAVHFRHRYRHGFDRPACGDPGSAVHPAI